MKNVYIKLIIAGSRTIESIPSKDLVAVAVGVIERGYDDGEEYATLDDVPEKYRQAVKDQLIEDGYITE